VHELAKDPVKLVEDDSTVIHTNTPDATDGQDLLAGWRRVRRAPAAEPDARAGDQQAEHRGSGFGRR
jgi:hypothetical protein